MTGSEKKKKEKEKKNQKKKKKVAGKERRGREESRRSQDQGRVQVSTVNKALKGDAKSPLRWLEVFWAALGPTPVPSIGVGIVRCECQTYKSRSVPIQAALGSIYLPRYRFRSRGYLELALEGREVGEETDGVDDALVVELVADREETCHKKFQSTAAETCKRKAQKSVRKAQTRAGQDMHAFPRHSCAYH